MKRSDYKFSKVHNFLESTQYKELCTSLFQNYKIRPTVIIDKDGNMTEDINEMGRIRSYSNDIELFRNILPNPAVELIYKLKGMVEQQGYTNLQPREYTFFYNPDSMGWHKDFNIEGHPDNLRYVTFFTLSEIEGDHKIKFVVSPNKEGPGLWKIGFDEWVPANTFISHVQLMGHEYVKNPDNIPMHVFSVQWYEIKP